MLHITSGGYLRHVGWGLCICTCFRVLASCPCRTVHTLATCAVKLHRIFDAGQYGLQVVHPPREGGSAAKAASAASVGDAHAIGDADSKVVFPLPLAPMNTSAKGHASAASASSSSSTSTAAAARADGAAASSAAPTTSTPSSGTGSSSSTGGPRPIDVSLRMRLRVDLFRAGTSPTTDMPAQSHVVLNELLLERGETTCTCAPCSQRIARGTSTAGPPLPPGCCIVCAHE